MAKKLGATKIGSVGYGISPSSSGVAKDTQKYAAPASGLKPVYLNTAVDFGSTDVGPIVLGLKNAGADAVYLPLDGNTNLAIAQGLQQNGVPMKAVLMASGYGQAMLDSPITKTLNSADIVSQIYKPAELKNDPAVKKFRADLKKYAGITGVPDYGAYTGYLSCDLAITGLQQAGKNPTGQGFIDGIRKLGTYKAADLTCQPLDMGLDTFGKTPTKICQYFVTFKNGKFVVMNNGKPIFGKLVGDPALITANAQGQAADVTTTAPPARRRNAVTGIVDRGGVTHGVAPPRSPVAPLLPDVGVDRGGSELLGVRSDEEAGLRAPTSSLGSRRTRTCRGRDRALPAGRASTAPSTRTGSRT